MFIVCVRYGGGLAVGEGVGNCGCEYMTGLMTMRLKLLKQFAGSTGRGHPH
jgi:glutamate synthase domain-containing protein 3